MISVLIPVYNYNIVALTTQVHAQLQELNLPFEILCLDDASPEISSDNDSISKLAFTQYLKSDHNLGRTNARQYLAEKANYDWLLFIDADVLPKTDAFIRNYLECIEKGFDAIYGGFAYYEEAPRPEYSLRWTYGSTHEQIPAIERNKKPYKVIISANFMIRKQVFLDINSQIEQKGYGFDNFFAALLKMNQVKVLHIDNEVYHLGIETSKTYLLKKEKAAETLLKYYKSGDIKSHQNDLLHFFLKLKRLRLNLIFSLFYKWFNKALKRNLLSKKPSMTILQLYRVSYMCYKDLNP